MLVYAAMASTAFSDEVHRHHEAHQHGVGQLGVVLEDDAFSFSLTVPSSDLVGFEHAAETGEQVESVLALEKTFSTPGKLFVFPQAAGCSESHSDLKHSLLEKEGEGGDHAKDHHHHSNSHSEVTLRSQFQCSEIDAVKSVRIKLFDEFPSLEKLEASIITSSEQKKAVLTRSSSLLKLP